MTMIVVAATALDPVALALGSAVIASLLTGGFTVLTNRISQTAQTTREKQVQQHQLDRDKLLQIQQLERDQLLQAQQLERDRRADARAIRDTKRARIEQTYRDVLHTALVVRTAASEEQFGLQVRLGVETVAERDQRIDAILRQANDAMDNAVIVLTLESDAQPVVKTVKELQGAMGLLILGHLIRARNTLPESLERVHKPTALPPYLLVDHESDVAKKDAILRPPAVARRAELARAQSPNAWDGTMAVCASSRCLGNHRLCPRWFGNNTF